MPRFPRSNINTNFFHVMVQGINKSYIFEYPEDIKYYIKILYTTKKEYNIKIMAYCIMNNHAHMLLKTEKINILSAFMHKVNTSYALYYNKKYNRVGYVFRDRYKSEGIYDKKHLCHCIKYIYDNPVKAKICNKPEEYKYSNYKKPIKIFDECTNYTFIDVDKNEKEICGTVIERFLLDNNINYNDLKNNNKKLRELVLILKNDYNISLRKIAEELCMGREKVRNLYRY